MHNLLTQKSRRRLAGILLLGALQLPGAADAVTVDRLNYTLDYGNQTAQLTFQYQEKKIFFYMLSY